ncbi:MAG: type 2 lanthipeptide synthetase LanM [Leptospirales bacterium]
MAENNLSTILDGVCESAEPTVNNDSPDWADTLLEVLELCADLAEQPLEQWVTQPFLLQDDIPSFAAAYIPFLYAGRKRLRERAGSSVATLSSNAHKDIERELLFTLARIATPTLDQEVSLDAALTGTLPWSVRGGDASLKRDFAVKLAVGGWLDLFTIYPVLARLMACGVERWVEQMVAFLRRLPHSPLGNNIRNGMFKNIAQACGDSHNGGKTVMLVEVQDGECLAYKSRSLALESGFQALLSCVNECGFSHPLRTISVVNAGNHGWMEFVPASPCRNQEEEHALNYRLGGLMCLLSFLQSTDSHRDNVVLAGEQAVIVDLETLLHPRITPRTAEGLGPGSMRMQQRGTCDPVWLETGFLPIPQANGSAPTHDFSLLGTSGPLQDRLNVSKLLDGFNEMYLLVCEHKAVVRQCLETLESATGRAVLRSTFTYDTLLQQSVQPELMRNGVTRGIRFEVLRSAALRCGSYRELRYVLDAELEALENLDIPYFEHVVSEPGSGLSTYDESDVSPLTEVLARLDSAEPANLIVLTKAIEVALNTSKPEEVKYHE